MQKRYDILGKKRKVSFYHHVSCPQETVIHGISLLSETNIFLSHTSPSPNQLNRKISKEISPVLNNNKPSNHCKLRVCL